MYNSFKIQFRIPENWEKGLQYIPEKEQASNTSKDKDLSLQLIFLSFLVMTVIWIFFCDSICKTYLTILTAKVQPKISGY